MWFVGGSIAALGLVLLVCMLVDWLGAEPAVVDAPLPARLGFRVPAMVIVFLDVVVGVLVALADENVGPWAYNGGYRLLGMFVWGVQLAGLALALALWLQARPAAARSWWMRMGIVLSWIVIAGVGVCYGCTLGG